MYIVIKLVNGQPSTVLSPFLDEKEVVKFCDDKNSGLSPNSKIKFTWELVSKISN